MRFFLDIEPPTSTHQMKKVCVISGVPRFYDPPKVVAARKELEYAMARHVPKHKMDGPLFLSVEWRFRPKGKHRSGEYRTTRPDTDNLQKLLKDVMTMMGFWNDDAQVAIEKTTKIWHEKPGIDIECLFLDRST